MIYKKDDDKYYIYIEKEKEECEILLIHRYIKICLLLTGIDSIIIRIGMHRAFEAMEFCLKNEKTYFYDKNLETEDLMNTVLKLI